MVIDILIAAVILLSMISGYRRGFLGTFLRTFGWLISAAGAWLAMPYISVFLAEHTGIYDAVRDRAAAILTPDKENFFLNLFSTGTDSLIDAASDYIAQLSFSVLVFTAALFIIRIIISAVSHAFDNDGNSVIGFINASAGMFIGFLRGVLISLILTALLFPALSLLNEDRADILSEQIDNSKSVSVICEVIPMDEIFIRESPADKDPGPVAYTGDSIL